MLVNSVLGCRMVLNYLCVGFLSSRKSAFQANHSMVPINRNMHLNKGNILMNLCYHTRIVIQCVHSAPWVGILHSFLLLKVFMSCGILHFMHTGTYTKVQSLCFCTPSFDNGIIPLTMPQPLPLQSCWFHIKIW